MPKDDAKKDAPKHGEQRRIRQNRFDGNNGFAVRAEVYNPRKGYDPKPQKQK